MLFTRALFLLTFSTIGTMALADGFAAQPMTDALRNLSSSSAMISLTDFTTSEELNTRFVNGHSVLLEEAGGMTITDLKKPSCLVQVRGDRDDFDHKLAKNGHEAYRIPSGFYSINNVRDENDEIGFSLKRPAGKPAQIDFYCHSAKDGQTLKFSDFQQLLGGMGSINGPMISGPSKPAPKQNQFVDIGE
jgi:hypothetical protein